MRTVIQDRHEFDTYLLNAKGKMESLIQHVGPDPVLVAVLHQLEAIEQWTSNNGNMTGEQKGRIVHWPPSAPRDGGFPCRAGSGPRAA